MTLLVKDANGTTQTVKTNDDLSGTAGAPSANVLSIQGTTGGTALTVTGPLTDAQLRAAAVPVAVAFPASQSVSATTPAVACVDRSGALTVGGTAQTLMAANPARRGYRVQNLSSTDLWINDKGQAATAAPPSIKLVAGALYESPAWGASNGSISIFGVATGQAFEAMEA